MYYQNRTVDTTPADAAITRRSPMTPACTLSDQEPLRSAKTRRVRASGVELFQGWRFNLPVKRAVGSERSSVSGPSITLRAIGSLDQ
jgi:predicted signal transduction protein with EAL and GGDEF domain